jgi:hypothetical protein
VTGATLAVPNGAAVPKPPVDAPASANPPEALNYPQPMTTNPDEHSAAVAAYLVAAGVPAAEVSGMHVTTTMAGGGPVRDGVQPAQSKLLWYTTHLERSLGGVPVESSYAFAALDNGGRVITEGVYWPAIPANVVSNARAFAERLAAPRERTAFMTKVRKAAPGAGDTLLSGQDTIVDRVLASRSVSGGPNHGTRANLPVDGIRRVSQLP